jgi:predicted DNA-binding transcriptional regulator AlpA
MEATDERLTKPAVAVLIGKSVTTLDRWHRLGLGPKPFKIGRSVVYRRRDVEAWIDAQESPTSGRT